MKKIFGEFGTHINWIFVISYFAVAIIAQILGGGWWYLLIALPISWLIKEKGRSPNWFYVAAIPILGFIVLLLLENRRKINAKDV